VVCNFRCLSIESLGLGNVEEVLPLRRMGFAIGLFRMGCLRALICCIWGSRFEGAVLYGLRRQSLGEWWCLGVWWLGGLLMCWYGVRPINGRLSFSSMRRRWDSLKGGGFSARAFDIG